MMKKERSGFRLNRLDAKRQRLGSSLAIAALAVFAIGPLAAEAATQVTTIVPSAGPSAGGSAVAIGGGLFQTGATVTIGGVSAGGVSVPNASQINATAPALSAGTLNDVVVTNPDSSTATLTKGWFADFLDVPASNPFHDSVEKIFRNGITSGCGGGNYCPDDAVTRAQMAIFLLRSKYGASFVPPPATGTVFDDVPASSFGAAFIERLFAEGITSGCSVSPPLYCPASAVARDQMAVFLLRAEHGSGYAPPPATGIFGDVPASDPFAPWIEQLYNEGITSGCSVSPLLYCPGNPNTRAQMAAFLSRTFNQEIVRLLERSTWGPNDEYINNVRRIGSNAYLDEQFNAPMSSYPTLELWPGTVPPTCDATCRRDNYSIYPLQLRFFENAFYGQDQLRQRVAFALHQMVVVSQRDIQQPSHMSPYLQILDRNAFGNFRQILYEMTLHPTMGQYLDMVRSTRTNPNENYAREILQLFSIGTDLLNLDGTPQRDAQGEPLPSYDQAIVDGFTRVLTGWTFAAQPQPGVVNYIDPMVLVANRHEQGTKQLLNGVVLPPCATPPANCTVEAIDVELNAAIDNIFNHANVGPFVSMHLIRQLVTSNPSPAYVRRVATVFNNNGQGARGDLKAVVRAILLDPEARNDAPSADFGHLKEPALFINNLLRAFNALSADGSTASDGYLGPQSTALDQDIFRAPTVFNYYPNDFVAPGTTILGPEFGILSANTTLRRANFVNTMLQDMNVNRTNPRLIVVPVGANSPAGTSIDLSPLLPLASNPAQLVGELNRLLMHGSMSTDMRDSIIQAVSAVSGSNPLLRARQAVYLVATSSQYQVQR